MSKDEAMGLGFTHIVPAPDNRRVYYFKCKVQADRFASEVRTKAFDLRYVELSPVAP